MLPTTGGVGGVRGGGVSVGGRVGILGSSSGLSSALHGGSSSATGGMKAMRLKGKRLWMYLRRLGRIGQMDFEVAMWQVLWLVVSPKRVYRSVYYHKQTKNQWARDDPAFLLIILLLLALQALTYSLVFGSAVLPMFSLMLSFIFFDFLIPGLIIATCAW